MRHSKNDDSKQKLRRRRRNDHRLVALKLARGTIQRGFNRFPFGHSLVRPVTHHVKSDGYIPTAGEVVARAYRKK